MFPLFLSYQFLAPPPAVFVAVEIPAKLTVSPPEFEKYGFSSGPPVLPPEYDSIDIRHLRDLALGYAQIADASYQTVVQALKPSYPLPKQVDILITYRYLLAAAGTDGNQIRINAAYALANQADLGIVVHELAHVVQSYRFDQPKWLVEGMADYVRYFCFAPPGQRPNLDPKVADPLAGYVPTAQFLAWIDDRFDQSIVPQINALLYGNAYSDSVWQRLTGKSLTDLASLWKASGN